MRKMKILQVIPYFTSEKGGDVKVVANISSELSKRGHEVTIISSDIGVRKSHSPSPEGVRLILFKPFFALGFFIYTPSMKKWLKIHLEEFDAVHIHTFRSYQNIMVSDLVRKKRVRYLVQAHGSVPTDLGNSSLKKLYDRIFLKRSLSSISSAIALNDTEAKNYLEIGIKTEQIQIIPNGMRMEHSVGSNGSSFRKKYKVDEGEAVVISVGRLNSIKGPDIFVRAIRMIIDNGVSVKAFLVGNDDGMMQSVADLARDLGVNDNVIMTGPLFGQDLQDMYAGADVVVIPSRYEAFPMVLLEACSHAKPIVLSDKCAIQELFKDYCWVAEPEPSAVSRAIMKILKDYPDASNTARKAKIFVAENYGIDSVINKLIAAYSGDRLDQK